MFERVHHVAYTVEDLDSYCEFFGDVLEMEEVDYREMPDDGYKAAVYELGETYIEIQEPLSREEIEEHGSGLDHVASEIVEEMETFLEEHGSGLNHVAYEVEDLAEALARFEEEKGIEREWDEPIVAPTFPDYELIDMDPDTSRGIYIQLVAEAE